MEDSLVSCQQGLPPHLKNMFDNAEKSGQISRKIIKGLLRLIVKSIK